MRHIVVGTAGHIDHGKSALVLALTGTDPDRLKEEKARGITIDLGFAHWEAPGLNVAFVDVPGHERFVRNMLAGAGGIDAVLLVVAADESVMPQTREHFEICRLLQVRAGLIVITKTDLVDPDLVDLVALEVRELVRGSFLDGAPVLGVSSRTGAGLDALRAALAELAARVPARSPEGPVRLPVDRVFSVKGFGTVVTGTLVSGRLAGEAEADVLPAGRRVKVRGLQVHGHGHQTAEAGQRVAVNLSGVEVADVQRGDTLATPGVYQPTRMCDVRLELIASAKPLRHGARVRLHQGTTEVLGRVALSGLVDAAGGGEAAAASEVPPGRSAYGRLRLEAPAVLTRGDRFILRAYSPPATIAGGILVDPAPPRVGIRTPAGRDRFLQLDPLRAAGRPLLDAAADAAAYLVAESDLRGIPTPALTSRLGLSGPDAEAVRANLDTRRAVVTVGDSLLSPTVLHRTGAAVLERLAEHHRAWPLEEGMPREEVRERTCANAADGVFERIVADLAAAGRIAGRDRLALSSHRLALSPDEERARDGLDRLYREAGLRPPDLRDAAAALGHRPDVVEKMAALLVRQKVLVRVDTLVFHANALARLKQELAERKTATAGPVTLDVGEFKDRYRMTRKFAIPLLEYLDRERVTRRAGDGRVLI
jgi:selenocysteine-specific elongation factor